ncbi:nitrogenase molybdenum-iron protein subunit beta [Halanaerobium saccharolyticum]|jgi:nitrogenase molybdenum-iron protein beta chain|uniref:Nitrogenase molybdenum-iron protein beta chain n=1 Tax=Halanaerobium saccharolyticum TaxID=43595 RepID=A0A2T5RJR0_9FIRM|nr:MULTISPECIES: nitrogenase molybdenum-iron protein subunit beta [Halanaerobium]KXS48847.1 MAG: nitrogenase molybdenum-iron protein beta chain [Halanaerobium sp. T82-1]OEG63170.1 MAG: nitrogenase molybdenum-iron protein subunit beta [Halanaerobium sp. MDAL1]PTV98912.1 Mo-nitrogenase MoFe protein subunit NifK [Halanaerobium saccharolyticum]PUU94393.1 MAG: nitrogenase molybdenum-iron protein beta chain [Halanaerobium sp.]TDP89032.1 Mo-nitrogenase MoFe protein subunit NifK [Halanaerobium sacchar
MQDLVPEEYKERNSLVINPVKTCQPIGAMYAALGIHGALPHSHGSQGCCSYHRMHLTKHFREPVVASSSSFTEGASVFGGRANLETALKNIFAVYDPEVVAINTTCLSETIGDDIGSIINGYDVPEGKTIIHASTPSYVGSHISGFSNMVKAMIKQLSEKNKDAKTNNKLNLIPGFVDPGDIREIKRILEAMDIDYILFPDQSDVLDTPLDGNYDMYPEGGVTIPELNDTGNSQATIALGEFASSDPAFELEKKHDVKPYTLKSPVGIKATDEFLMQLMKLTGKEVPAEIEKERGQLVDIIADTHHQFHGKKVAIYGDPDIVISLTEFVLSLGMRPAHVLTGTPDNKFEKIVEEMMEDADWDYNITAGGDLFQLHQWIKNDPVDLMLGNSYGKLVAKQEDIPLVRVGFPILDRTVHSYLPTVGYKGAMLLLEKISGALLDRRDRDTDIQLTEFVL